MTIESNTSWDDACWEMCLACEPDDDGGFKSPSYALVAEFIKKYPQHEEDFIDFAATCREQDFFLVKYPPPECTQEELDKSSKKVVAYAMRRFRAALKRRDKK